MDDALDPKTLMATTPFRKISRVGSLLGATRWYLSEDCLLASKGNYTVEYRRFYLPDLESIVVWPSRLWLLRLILPGALLGALGVSLGVWVDSTTGAIFGGVGLAWAGLELALGPTAETRIRTTGASVDLALVKRTRRAHKVLAKIDAAVRAARASVTAQPTAHVDGSQPAKPSGQASPESTPAQAPIVDLT
jgi:hypothetical protein